MKREIKFEYGFDSVINGIVKKVYYLHEIPNIKEKCGVWNVLPIKYVREYTGLKDKNGVEIYEGDIIKPQSYHPISEVFLMNGSWKVNGKMAKIGFGSWANTVEVIGNIYENPELL